jgi:hypothetical protein
VWVCCAVPGRKAPEIDPPEGLGRQTVGFLYLISRYCIRLSQAVLDLERAEDLTTPRACPNWLGKQIPGKPSSTHPPTGTPYVSACRDSHCRFGKSPRPFDCLISRKIIKSFALRKKSARERQGGYWGGPPRDLNPPPPAAPGLDIRFSTRSDLDWPDGTDRRSE